VVYCSFRMLSVFCNGFRLKISIAVFIIFNFTVESNDVTQKRLNFKASSTQKLNKNSLISNINKNHSQLINKYNEVDFKSFQDFEIFLKNTFLENNIKSNSRKSTFHFNLIKTFF
jgi:hypothetical protein